MRLGPAEAEAGIAMAAAGMPPACGSPLKRTKCVKRFSKRARRLQCPHGHGRLRLCMGKLHVYCLPVTCAHSASAVTSWSPRALWQSFKQPSINVLHSRQYGLPFGATVPCVIDEINIYLCIEREREREREREKKRRETGRRAKEVIYKKKKENG